MKYLSIFFTLSLLLLVVTATFNRIIDPYGLFWSPVFTGINEKKVYSTNRSQITKELFAEKIDVDIILIGNSRIEMGFDDQSSHFSNKTVYNFASPGISLETQVARASYAMETMQRLDTIYISLDFIDFLIYSDKPLSKRPELITSEVNHTLSYYLSLNTTIDSVKTIYNQDVLGNHINKSGTHYPEDYIATIKYEGIMQLYKQKLQQVKRMMSNSQIRLLDESGQSSKIKLLRDFLKKARIMNIEVKAFINPYQVSYLHVIKDSGKLALFSEWKRKLTTVFLEEKHPLFDFSIINPETKEKVSYDENHKIPTYFWEPAHYTMRLGEKLLDDLNKNGSELIIGRLLTTANIDDILSETKYELNNNKESWNKLQHQLDLN